MDEHDNAALLTLDEAVQVLGTSRPTLYRLLSQGEIKGLKVGRQWRFRRADLTAYMERGPVAIAATPAADIDGEMGFLNEQLRAMGAEVKGASPDEDTEEGTEAERSIRQLAHTIIKLAIMMKASDIHIEPISIDNAVYSLLRVRVDGALHEVRRMNSAIHEGLLAQFKVMADMSLSERGQPQDGRLPVRFGEEDFDLLTSAIPTASTLGEAFTMRILAKSRLNVAPGLDGLPLSEGERAQLRRWLQRPWGLIVFNGPTGSGKTTTALSALREKAAPETKTVSVEFPVETTIPYVTQVQIRPKMGLTFASTLRAITRQDPDVIYLSEMPDLEVARLALDAAFQGHLLLTTLHAPDAVSALTLLTDIGLEPYLVAAAAIGIVAQQLCRTICPHCKEAYQMPSRDLRRFGLEPEDLSETITLYRGRGCERCRQRGYLGRTALFSLLTVTEEIKEMILSGASRAEIATAAEGAGMVTLRQAGLQKVLAGETTPEEVMRVVGSAF